MKSAFAAAVLAALLSSAAADAAVPPAPATPPCTRNGVKADGEYLALANRVLSTTQTANRMTMVIDMMTPALLDIVRKSNPQIPEKVVGDFKTALRAELVRQIPVLVTAEACVYVRHFSKDELRQLAAFYDGPLGRKLLSEMPGILKENMAMGQVWGMQAGQAAVTNVMAKYRKGGGKI